MDKHDIRRKAQAARRFTEQVAPGVDIVVQLPTRQEVAVAAARAGVHAPGNETAGLVAMQRDLLLAAVVGWGKGVRLTHLLPDEADEPLQFDPDLVGLLLDAQPLWEDKLRDRFAAERSARLARLEDAEKNSLSASTGNSPAAVRLTTDSTSETPASSLVEAPGLFSA